VKDGDIGRTIVVTGASRGLGCHIATAAHEAGYRVIGLARDAVHGRPYEVRACDVSDPQQVSATFRSLRSEPGLYGLVNAAGVASLNLVLTTPAETMQHIVGVNLLGTMYCCGAMGRILAKRKEGRVVNFSTIAVSLALKGEAVYVGSKAGVEGFSRAFAREMADFGVTVNTVAPGPVDTDLTRKVPPDQIESVVSAQIIPRMGDPGDVWDAVCFLLTEQARMISGQVIHIGGA
jgi:3-oxoacyl-[acyl-carrier protein] reductase